MKDEFAMFPFDSHIPVLWRENWQTRFTDRNHHGGAFESHKVEGKDSKTDVLYSHDIVENSKQIIHIYMPHISWKQNSGVKVSDYGGPVDKLFELSK